MATDIDKLAYWTQHRHTWQSLFPPLASRLPTVMLRTLKFNPISVIE